MPLLLEILDGNFEKEPSLRARIIHRFPHFGTNESEIDALMKWLGETLVAACKGLTAYRNEDPCIPGAFSYKEHSRHGSRTGASPGGRLAGTALAAGSGAVQGRETAGPTAALCSDLAWDQRLFLGGIANNLMFFRKQMSGESLDKLYDLVMSFFDQRACSCRSISSPAKRCSGHSRNLRNTRTCWCEWAALTPALWPASRSCSRRSSGATNISCKSCARRALFCVFRVL